MKSNSSTNDKAKKPGGKSDGNSPQVEVGTLVTQPHGGALRHGSKPGTNRGGSGRPRNELKEKLRKALDQPEVLTYLQGCLCGQEGPQAFLRALGFCMDRVYGRVPNVTQLTDEHPPLQIIVRRE